MSKSLPILHIDQLQPGLYIHIPDLAWIDHPFMFNSFRLTSERQIKTLLEMGIHSIPYDPARSTAEPLLLEEEPEPIPPLPHLSAEDENRIQAKQARMAVIMGHRKRLAQGEKDYRAAIGSAGKTIEGMLRDPVKARYEATQLVRTVAANFIGKDGVTLSFIALERMDSTAFQHATNVMILALTLGKAMGFDKFQLESLGLGALLHDIGEVKIPSSVLRSEERNAAEENFYRMHVQYGLDLLKQGVSNDVLACVGQHHERADGRGFPEKLPLEQISIMARVVAIADRYDKLCNPLRVTDALTPAEALSRMFAKEIAAFDRKLMALFIKQMGVYPPGSFVQLSNGSIGMVVSVNAENSLKPGVMIYEPGVSREESLIVALEDMPDIKIEHTLRPKFIDQDIVAHLNPKMRTVYYASKR